MKRKSFRKRQIRGGKRNFRRGGKFHHKSKPKRIKSITLSRGGIRL